MSTANIMAKCLIGAGITTGVLKTNKMKELSGKAPFLEYMQNLANEVNAEGGNMIVI